MMKMRRIGGGLLAVALLVAGLTGCTRDPNVKKLKYLESGNRYFEKEKYREAAIQYLNALQVDPRYGDAHYQLAQCYLKLLVINGAYNELLRTVDLQPENLKAQVDLGNILLAARRFKDAQEKADLVIAKDPRNVDAHVLRANSFAGLENMEASLKEMQQAIELAPDQPKTYVSLGILQSGTQKNAAAEESFKKAIQLDPKSLSASLALGNFYQTQKQWADAEKEFRRAISIDPKKSIGRIALARLFIFQKDRAKAEQVLRDAKAELPNDPEGYRLLGDFYFGMGEIPKAVDEFASLIKDHPKDVKVKKNYIQLLILTGKIDEARNLNDGLLKDNPRDVDCLIHKGQIFNRTGKYKEAADTLEAALKGEPENPVAHFHLGLAYNAQGNLQRAETEWREAIKERPNMPAAQQALAGVAIRKGDVQLLQQTGDALIAIDPQSPGGYLLRAAATQARRGSPAIVEMDLKRAIDVAPQNPVGYSRMAGYRFLQNRMPEAEKLYEQALEKDPNFYEGLSGLIVTYAGEKKLPQAAQRIRAQLAKSPENSAFYYLLAQVLRDQKDFPGAEGALNKALELDKNNLDALALLGQIQVQTNALDRAAASYSLLTKERPTDPRGYILLGAVYELKKDSAKAEEMYKQALELQADNAIASNNLAFIMTERGENLDVAMSHAETARKGLPDSANVADTLAWIYFKRGRFGLAIDLLEESVRREANNPTFHFHLGLAYQKADNKPKAKIHLERAVQLMPKDSPDADAARKALAELGG